MEQQENLRRFVDEWRGQVWKIGSPPLIADAVSVSVKIPESYAGISSLDSENITLQKLLSVLAFDCTQIAKLRHQAHDRIYPRLLVYEHSSTSEGSVQVSFAKSYTFFYELKTLIVSLRSLLRNLLQQIRAAYLPAFRKSMLPSIGHVHLNTAFEYLTQGLTMFITIDQIIAHNSAIGHAMSMFTRMLQSVRSEPVIFGIKSEEIELLDQSVAHMDDLLTSGLFQRFLHEDESIHFLKEELKETQLFLDEMAFYLRASTSNILMRMNTSTEQPNDREKLVGILGGFILYSWLNGETNDKKTLKLVSKIISTLPLLHPITNVKLLCMEFLVEHSPPWIRSAPLLKDVRREFDLKRRAYLTSLDDALIRNASGTQRAVTSWLISFTSLTCSTAEHLSNQSLLETHLRQITQGIVLANNLQRFIRSTIDLHVLLEVPISKEQVRQLRYGVELLKAMQDIYQKIDNDLLLSRVHIVRYLTSHIRSRLLELKFQLETDLNTKFKSSNLNLFNRSPSNAKEVDTKLMDSLCALNVGIKSLDHLTSFHGRSTFHLAFDVLIGLQNRVQEFSTDEIRDYISLIELLVDLHRSISMVTDCSFLYWNKEIMPTCFAMVYSDVDEARHIQFILSAFLDGAKLLQAGCAEKSVVNIYENVIHDCLVTELVEPVCHDIETDLRLHVHSAHLKGAVNVNPTKTGVRDLSWFLKIKPLRLLTKFINIKSSVEGYLNAAFYDHAAVALHNWKTYNEMKILAEQKYGLVLDAIHLPGQTLEQGVDVLEIMRNIHIFVACYTYNLNTQMFVEKSSNAKTRKHLNTVNVKHVSNSFRTHGTGIMSTTVNFAYQFLAQKFVVFSQFLFDDHIKSRLVKEQRFYKENKMRPESGYPVERAEKLIKDIRKLGLTEEGLSFLDQFRCLIAEMGNALGFVRMVRLGGLHYCTTTSSYTQHGFEEAVIRNALPERGIEAGKILDRVLQSQNLSVDQTNYFSILTRVFHQELQSNDNLHLRDFFLLVPALTTNAADAISQSKEKLHKRGRDATNATFTDDGFALGIAYILKVLGQDKQFDSLHWFQSVNRHILSERARLQECLDIDSTGSGMNGLQAWSQKLASLSKEEAQNIQMAIKRLTSILTEMELIEFTLTSARVFFQ